MTEFELAIRQKVGLFADEWMSHERALLSEHGKKTGQPLVEEVERLWFTRRSNNKCPISDECPPPKRGAVFCKHHRSLSDD